MAKYFFGHDVSFGAFLLSPSTYTYCLYIERHENGNRGILDEYVLLDKCERKSDWMSWCSIVLLY